MALNAQGFGSFDGTHQFSMKDYQDYQNTYGNQPGWDARQQQYLGYYGATPDMLASGATQAAPTPQLNQSPAFSGSGFGGIQGGQQPVAPKMMDGGNQSGGVYTGGGYTLPNGGLPGVGANYVPGSNPNAGSLYGTQGPNGPANNTPDIKSTLQGMDWSAGNTAGATQQTMQLMQKYGWTPDQVGSALGFTGDQIKQHIAQYGGQSGGQQTPWQMMGVPSNWNADGSARYSGGGSMGGGATGGPAYGGGNPYLDSMAGGMVTQANRNFQTQTLPAISSAAQQAGGYGGSRQGVVEANAANDFSQGLNNSLANLYGTDYTNQQNRNLTKQGLDQTYTLGQGALDNQKYATDTGFYTQQRQLDQSGQALGANLITSGSNGQWSPINQANATYSPYSGLGSTASGTSQGGGLTGAAGGALSGASLAQLLKLWGG